MSEAARRQEVLDNKAKHSELQVEVVTMAAATSDAQHMSDCRTSHPNSA